MICLLDKKKNNSIFFSFVALWLMMLNSCTVSGFMFQNDGNPYCEHREEKKVIVSKINISGNNITKENIILRELTFCYGDTLFLSDVEDLIESSKSNLLNESLFNYVDIECNAYNNYLQINIKVEERWYMWPSFLLTHADRNFNSWYAHKDFSSLQYGFNVNKYNFRGANEVLKLKFRGGFTKSLGIDYRDVFIDDKRRHGLSFFASYSFQNQLNYGSDNNKPLRLKQSKHYVFENYSAAVKYAYRKYLYCQHSIHLSYSNSNINDTVTTLNENFFGKSATDIQFWMLNYSFIFDKRDRKHYPSDGYLTELNIGNVFYNNKKNYPLLAMKVAYYQSFEKRISFAASSLYSRQLNTNAPYAISSGLGYDHNLPAYEYYVVDGHSFLLNKFDLKYQIMKQKIVNLPIWPFSKVEQFNKIHFAAYLKVFAGCAYVSQHKEEVKKWDNKLANNWLYSYGAGVDILTYYDRIVRVALAVNKMGERGVYIHFKQGI